MYSTAIKVFKMTGNDINKRLKSNRTYLHNAVHYENKNFITELIKNGADVNIPDINGETPLHYAARNFNKDIVKILIDNGADNNIKRKQVKCQVKKRSFINQIFLFYP